MPYPVKITPALVEYIVPCLYLDVSLRRVAQAAGVTDTTLHRAIERGRRTPAPAHLQRLAAAFDAMEGTGEYWEHRQGLALGELERAAQRGTEQANANAVQVAL